MSGKDLIIVNARITTLDRQNPSAEAVAIRDGKFLAVGSEVEVRTAAPEATVIDAKGRRLIPGLIDSHIPLIRGGLNYNMELRWDGVPSLSEAMAMLKRQVDRTPAPQWVRVVGGLHSGRPYSMKPPTANSRWNACNYTRGHSTRWPAPCYFCNVGLLSCPALSVIRIGSARQLPTVVVRTVSTSASGSSSPASCRALCRGCRRCRARTPCDRRRASSRSGRRWDH
jgi:hypothetical protein